MSNSVEYLFSNKWLIKKLKKAELKEPPPGECGWDQWVKWHAREVLLPILQSSSPMIKKEYQEGTEDLEQIVLSSIDGWVNISFSLSNSDEEFLLHVLRWFYVGQFHCLILDEIKKNEVLYSQGLLQISLIKSEKYEEAYTHSKDSFKDFQSPKRPRGRPGKPFWLKLLMAYDFILLHCTRIKHSEYPNLQPPISDAWIVLDAISKKYKQIDSKSFKKARVFSSGDAVRRHLKGLQKLPGNRYNP